MPELSDRVLARSEHETLPALDRLKMKLKALTSPDELADFNESEVLAPGYVSQQNAMAEHIGRATPFGRDEAAEIKYRDVDLVEKYHKEQRAKEGAKQPIRLRKAQKAYTDEFMKARRAFMEKEKIDEEKRTNAQQVAQAEADQKSKPQREALKKAGEEYRDEFAKAREEFANHEAELAERERKREEERTARQNEQAAKKKAEAEEAEKAKKLALAQSVAEYSSELEQGRAQFPQDQERWDQQSREVDERLRARKQAEDAHQIADEESNREALRKSGEDYADELQRGRAQFSQDQERWNQQDEELNEKLRKRQEEKEAQEAAEEARKKAEADADGERKQQALQQSRDEYADELQRGREQFPEDQERWGQQEETLNEKLRKQQEERKAKAEAEANEKRKALQEAQEEYGDELQRGREQFDQKQQSDAEKPPVTKTNASVNSDRNARHPGEAAKARQEMRDNFPPKTPPDDEFPDGSVYPTNDDETPRQISPDSTEFQQLLESRISQTLKDNPDALLDPYAEIEGYFQREDPQYIEDLKQITGQISEPVGTDVKVIVSIAVAGHQEEASIYESLKSYTHQTLSPNEYEILLFINWPEQDKQGNPVKPDKTREEVERFKKDYPDIPIRTVQKVLPTKDARMGKILKYTHDTALYRHYTSGKTAGDAFFVFNDADNKGIDPRYLESIVYQFETDQNVDGIRGQLDWDPEAYASYPAVHIGTRLFQTLNEIGRSRQTRRLRAEQGVDAVPAGMNAGRLPSSGANFACKASIYAAVGGSAPEKTHGADVLLGKTILMARDNDTTRIQKGSSSTRVYTSARRAVNRFINEGLAPIEQWKDTKGGEGCGAFDAEVRSFQANTEHRIDYSNPSDVARVQEELEYVIDRTVSRYLVGDKTIKDKNSSYFRKALRLLGIEYEVTEENNVRITNMDSVARNLSVYQEDAVKYRDKRAGKDEEETPHRKKQNKVMRWVRNIAGKAMSRVRKPKEQDDENEAIFPLPSLEMQKALLEQSQKEYQQEFQAAQENYAEPQLQAADSVVDETEEPAVPVPTPEQRATQFLADSNITIDDETRQRFLAYVAEYQPEYMAEAYDDFQEAENAAKVRSRPELPAGEIEELAEAPSVVDAGDTAPVEHQSETHPEKTQTDYDKAVSQFIAQNNIQLSGNERQRFILYLKSNNRTDIEQAYDDYLKEKAPVRKEVRETAEAGGNPIAEAVLGMAALDEHVNPQAKTEAQSTEEVTEDMIDILKAGAQNNAEPWQTEFLRDTDTLKHMQKPGLFRSLSREQLAQFDRIMTNSLDRMSDLPTYESSPDVLLKSASRNLAFARVICQRNSPARELIAEKLEDMIDGDPYAMNTMHEYTRVGHNNVLDLFSLSKRDTSYYKGVLTATFRNKELHPTELANLLGIPEVRELLKQAVLGIEVKEAENMKK